MYVFVKNVRHFYFVFGKKVWLQNSSASSSSSLRRIYADQSHRSTSRRGAPSHIFISAAASQRACGSPFRHPLAWTPRQEPRTAEPRKPLMMAVMAAKLEVLVGCLQPSYWCTHLKQCLSPQEPHPPIPPAETHTHRRAHKTTCLTKMLFEMGNNAAHQ